LPHLTKHDFANLFGTTVDRLPETCLRMIAEGDWSYRPVTGEERDRIVIDLLQRVEERKLTTVSNEDKSRWLQGWGENLKAFREKDGSLDALVPKYFRESQPVRLFGDFVQPSNPQFELRWYEVFRQWFFQINLAGFENIFEFGCGSGFNVAELAHLYPKAKIYGLDWAQPSVDIVNELRTRKSLNVEGRAFDFFHPDTSLDVPPGSAVVTIGALEQTGTNWGTFLDFLLAKKPRCVFHIEPIYEWYDESNLVDYTAIKAHAARNFWRGFPPRLKELERAGRLRILHSKRAYFGSLVLEGFSQLSWVPL
jgi:SAM-dependent methyltransferase